MGEGYPQVAGSYLAGSRVGGYLLEEQIGQGGMAVVFRALDERLGRQVALKILAPALAADAAFRQRFIRESRAAAAVDHPNIIPVFEAGESGGALFIAMRYVRGGDVRSLLSREGSLPASRVAAIVSPVAAALDAAHAAGLVHRDVKPANMLLDVQQGRPVHVYLSDFGLSKEALATSGLTGTGQFLGTVDYAAPEQADGRPVDGRTDQYALGCAAFEMLCGEPPFPRDHGLAVLHAHLSAPPPPISSRLGTLSAGLDPVLARVLAKSPDDRYASCAEFAADLRRAAGIGRYDEDPPAAHAATELARAVGGAGGRGAGQQAAAGGAGTWPDAAYSGGPIVPGFGRPPAAGQPGQPFPDPYLQRTPAPAGRRVLLAAAAAVGLAAAAVIGYLILTLTSSHGTGGGRPPAAAGTTGSPAPSSGRPSARQGQPSPAGAGWTTYRDPSGFSVRLPPGWAESSANRTGAYPGVNFTGPVPGFDLFISWTSRTGDSALTPWQAQAASFARNDPTYRKISLKPVSYRSYNAAVWEFTNIHQGVLTHVIDWGFIVTPGQLGYAIELYGPQADWARVYASTWHGFLGTFQPAR